jgi:hypothetical protein
MMFHSLSNRKATESALMRDKELCRYNRVISSQARYVSGIRISVANTRTNGSHNQKQRNKLLAQSQSYEKIHKIMTHLGKNNYTPNASTKSIILLHNNGGPYYILQWGIYKKSSPQFVLRVRDIFYAIKCF